MNNQEQPLDSAYLFYLPPVGRFVTAGADEHEVMLPQIPLPLELSADADSAPSDHQLGVSLYSYLRRFPDCPRCEDYAQLLQQAFPYYLSDIGAQIIMLEAKDVDGPYIRRKISYLKILVLISPGNPLLLQKLGVAFFELGMIYVELIHIRREFSHALTFLQRSIRIAPQDTTTLNVLGQICYLMGDYPAVLRYWQGVVDQIPDCPAKQLLDQRMSRIAQGQHPQSPLIGDLEAIGIATEHFAAREFEAATEIMNRLEEEAIIPEELPSPEFFYFLALCREKSDDLAGAFEAYGKALQIDPDHQASSAAIDRIAADNSK